MCGRRVRSRDIARMLALSGIASKWRSKSRSAVAGRGAEPGNGSCARSTARTASGSTLMGMRDPEGSLASPTGRLVIPAVAGFVQPGAVAPRASRAKLDVMFVARVRSLALLSALTCACGRVGVVGHGSSRRSLVASSVYNEAGIPQITPTSTSRLLHAVGPWTFMLAPDDSAEGAFMAAFAAERLGARRVSI